MNRRNWLAAGIVGVLAALVYLGCLAGYAYPGESARLMAAWRGLAVAASPGHPLMGVLARLTGASNWLSAICGLIAVVTLFHLVAGYVAWCLQGEDADPRRRTLPLVAATVASVVFMLTPAVLSAATHLEPRMFDFAWLLLSLSLAFPFLRLEKLPAWLFAPLLAACVALGVCDSAIFAAFLPFYLALIVGVAKRRGRNLGVQLASFVIYLAVFLPLALGLLGVSFADVAHQTLVGLHGYHKEPGWLFVALFVLAPFVACLFACRRAFDESPSSSQWIFHVAMTVAAVLAVATPLSPSALMESSDTLPVATSAFAAAVCGYLAAYWWKWRKRPIGVAVGSLLAFVLVVSCAWQLFAFDSAKGLFADRLAQKILDDLGGRRWLVTDGTLDDHLALVADAAGRKVNLVSLARDLDADYLASLKDLVEKERLGGKRNAELKLSCSLGVLPFVQDWLRGDPSAAKELAIFGAPDIWYSVGLTPVPEFLFFGGDQSRSPDPDAWKEFDVILHAPKGWGSYRQKKVSDPVARLRLNMRRHVGFVANNRGVYLQDQHRDDEAWKQYELVLNEIDRDNICALFNEVGMIGEKHPAAVAKRRELDRMIRVAVDDPSRRYLLWRLGTYYGYIRNPDTFVRLGYAWARSGRPGDALSQIRRAIDFVPTDKKLALLSMMASLYASENDQKKSRRIYQVILEKDAADHDALIGMMRLELLDGNSQKALEYLQRATANAGDGKRAKIELAMVSMMKGELAKAKDLLRGAADQSGDDLQPWSLLAAVTMQQIDAAHGEKEKSALTKELEDEILPAMEKRAKDQFDYYLQTTKGFLMLRKGDEQRRAARDAFVNAAKSRPDIAATQDIVLGLDISLDDKENAETHAKEVLRRNRKAPLANYIMGSLALGKGKYTEAESYLRIAAEAPQPVVLALNDLAEVLRRSKKYDEAERYARKATENAPSLYVAWETLGSVLMDADKGLDEAEACIRKACELSKGKDGHEADVRMLVSLARVQIRRQDLLHAKVTIRKVRSRINELSEFERREFESVSQGAR